MTTWTSRTPPTTEYSNRSIPSTSYTNRVIPTTEYSTRTVPSTDYTSRTDVNFLLKEDSFFLLLETGDKIMLENSYSLPITWTGRVIPT